MSGLIVTLIALPANAGLPAGITDVTVTAGALTSGIDGRLHPAGSIAGTVTATAGGAGIAQGRVTAYEQGKQAGTTVTDVDGSYVIGGLRTANYVVCAEGPSTPPSGTGFLPRCYQNVAWNGGPLPSGTTKVSVVRGEQSPDVNLSLPSAAAISGTVTSPTADPLASAWVYAIDRKAGTPANITFTDDSGAYLLPNLHAKTYDVCVKPTSTTNQVGTGYRPRCFDDVAWDGRQPYPTAATALHPTLGTPLTGVDVQLPVGAAVSGTVTDAVSAGAIKFASVNAFDAAGHFLDVTSTDDTGGYRFNGLPVGTVFMCVRPGGIGAYRYSGECWNNVSWDGQSKPPAGSDAVTTTRGGLTTNVNFALNSRTLNLASIAGQVTDHATGNPVENAYVEIFRADGTYLQTAYTTSTGDYLAGNLKPSSKGYFVCVTANNATAPPTYGWAPRCYGDVAWNSVKVPNSAKLVTLAPGDDKTGKDVSLRHGGAITGTVGIYGTATTLNGVSVLLITKSGAIVTTTPTLSGSYTFDSLSPGNYDVCFIAPALYKQANYLGQCYDQQPWNGQL